MPGTHRANTRITFVVLATGLAAFALLQSMLIPVLPVVQDSLNTTPTGMTWVLTAYLLSASVATPIVGRIGDMVGKERMFLVALLTLTVGSVIAALATSVEVLIAARVIQGIGGGVQPLAFGIIRDKFPVARVPGAIGALSAATAAAAGLGIAIGGPIESLLNYHWLFWIPGLMVAAAAVGAYVFIKPEGPPAFSRISWTPAVFLAGWLVALLLVLSQGNQWGWGSAKTIGLIAIAIALAVGWVVVEMHVANPLIDMRMMRLRAVWTSNVVTVFIGAGTYASFVFVPRLLETPSDTGYGLGLSANITGLLLLPQSVAAFALGVASGWTIRRLGAQRVLFVAMACTSGAFALMTVAHGEAWQIVLFTTIMGGGFGAASASVAGIVVNAVPAHQTGAAAGMNANIRTIGQSVGAAVMSTLVTAHLAANGVPEERGYVLGFALLAVVTAIGAGAALLIPRVYRWRRPLPEDTAIAELGAVAGGTLIEGDTRPSQPPD